MLSSLFIGATGFAANAYMILGWIGGSPVAFLADLPIPPPGTFEPWLINLLLGVSILAAIFWCWNQGKEALGRKPPVDKQIAKMAKDITDLQTVVVGSATKTEVNSLHIAIIGSASKQEMGTLESHLKDRIEDKFKELDNRRREDIAGLHDKVESTTEILRAEIEDKAKETRGVITDLPLKLIQLLQQTGAIGRNKS